jgi:hypothetical protein
MSDYWSWNNSIDGDGTSIDSDTGSAGDLVTANLRDPRVGKPWRAGAMPVTLTVGLPGTGGVSIIGLFGANLAALTSLEITAYLDDVEVWTDEADDFTGTQIVFVMTDDGGYLSPINADTIVITATGSTLFQVGRLWVGTADWTPATGHDISSSRRVQDLSAVMRTPRSGARLVDRGERRRIFTANYSSLQQAEFDETLYQIDVERGLAAQMLFVPQPEIYGLVRGPILGGLTELEETAFVGFLTASRSLTILEDG